MSALAKVRKQYRASGVPIALIYGPPGVGKTTGAMSFPDPVIIPVEDGIPVGLDVDAFPVPQTYQEVIDDIIAVADDPDKTYKTVVIDSVDALETLLWKHVCAKNNWASIEDPGFGKGYIEAANEWVDFMRLLHEIRDDTQIAIVMIGHSETVRFEPPGMEPYAKYGIKLHKRASAIVDQECDLVGFLNFDVSIKKTEQGFGKTTAHAEGGGTRFLHVEGRPAFTAKNRYSGMPAKILISKGQTLFSQLGKHLEPKAADNGRPPATSKQLPDEAPAEGGAE